MLFYPDSYIYTLSTIEEVYMIKNKRQYYKKDDQKDFIQTQNELKIESEFIESPAHIGWDSVILDVNAIQINDALLAENKGKHITVIRTSLAKQETLNNYQRYQKVRIFMPNIGEFILGHGDVASATFTRLELIHGGVNVGTVDTDGLINRFHHACDKLQEYGITIDRTQAELYKAEIAFTFSCDKILPINVRQLITYAFSRDSKTLATDTYNYTSTPKDVHRIASHKFQNQKYVLYDKTAKAESLAQISSKKTHKIRVYRLELVINKKKIEQALKSNSIFKITDTILYNYAETCITNAIDYYAKDMSQNSSNLAYTLLHEAYMMKGNHYTDAFKRSIDSDYRNTHIPTIIDCETFIFMPLQKIFDKSNWAARRRTLIHTVADIHKDLRRNSLDRMDGWEVERILNLMLCTVKNRPNPNIGVKDNLLFFQVSYGCIKNRDNYMHNLISAPKKYVHVQHDNLIRERITQKWSDPNFELAEVEMPK